MAWTSLDSTPGTLDSSRYIDPTAPLTLNPSGAVYADTNHIAYSPGVDIARQLNTNSPLGFPNAINQGWINFSELGGGGGGSVRPSSGFLYPRGF